ncbi:FMN reductase [Devosia sp. D6-9]|nr:FMN reductase [Devosia sp. D6-9]
MTSIPRIGIIIGTTREKRFADRPAQWLFELASRRNDAEFEIVDLRDYPMPFFDEAISPAFQPPANPVAQLWAQKLASLDGFVFVTGEYNHSIPAVLKNALDYAYKEFNRKPATFLAYGALGGSRAVEHLRGILAELHVATIKHAIHINRPELVGMMMEGKDFADFPYLEEGAGSVLEEIVWWARALKAGRSQPLAA